MVEGLVREEAIDDSGKTSFLVTFETGAYEDGHINWLRKKLGPWIEEMKHVKGILSVKNIAFKKAPNKKGRGSISLSMEVKGAISPSPKEVENTFFLGQFLSMLRKTLAMTVLSHFRPQFNYINPKFDALHVHSYVFVPVSSNWKTATKRLTNLETNHPLDFSNLIRECGAMFTSPGFTLERNDEGDIVKALMTIRWRVDASETQREILERILDAYFKGMEIDMQSLEVKPG